MSDVGARAMLESAAEFASGDVQAFARRVLDQWDQPDLVGPGAIRMRRRRALAPDVTLEQRRSVLERDGDVCALCAGSIPPPDLHIDHRVPVARGGRTTLDNLQPAHRLCNQSKGAS